MFFSLSPRALLTASAIALGLAASACASTTAQVIASSPGSIGQVMATPANGPLMRVAVSAFDFRASQGGAIGAGLADMLTQSLSSTGRFIVLEREGLRDVTAEQDLGNTGRFDRSTVAPVGRLEGAQLLVRGSVTEFEPACRGGTFIIVGGNEACVTINLRIIDAATGRIVNATTVRGTSGSNSIGLAGPGLPIGLGAYQNTPMEAAMRNAIDQAVQYIAATKV